MALPPVENTDRSPFLSQAEKTLGLALLAMITELPRLQRKRHLLLAHRVP